MKKENKETMKIINVDGTEFISLDYHNQIVDELINDDETKQEVNFNVGDIVVLKSGGPLMTISSFIESEKLYNVSWFKDDECYGESFYAEELALHDGFDIEEIKQIVKKQAKIYNDNSRNGIMYKSEGFEDGAIWMLNELVGDE